MDQTKNTWNGKEHAIVLGRLSSQWNSHRHSHRYSSGGLILKEEIFLEQEILKGENTFNEKGKQKCQLVTCVPKSYVSHVGITLWVESFFNH